MTTAHASSSNQRGSFDKDVKRFGFVVLAGCGLVAVIVGIYLFRAVSAMARPFESSEMAEVEWSAEGGEPYVVRVTVIDASASPVPDAEVWIDNNSGGNSEVTDKNGTAVLRMGEPDFSGLEVNGVRLVSRPYAYRLGSPNVVDGLNIDVRLKQ